MRTENIKLKAQADSMTVENRNLVSLQADQDQEQSVSQYEDILKEQHYRTEVASLEDQLEKGAIERQRHERVTESLRQKHSTLLEQKNEEIADLSKKLSDAKGKDEQIEVDGLEQLDMDSQHSTISNRRLQKQQEKHQKKV